jgi:tetratricopeptide (TPR) repeat protein
MGRCILFALLLGLLLGTASAYGQAPSWLTQYQRGERLMGQGDYQQAALHFLRAIREKGADNERERLSGTRTIPYYPRRELGICLFYLGIRDFAQEELQASIQQSPSDRARSYLNRLQR